MESPLPQDPYSTLGVAKDASAAAIKAQYRKLVLKYHPDKVQDEAQKQIAADQFHRIQTAWELIGDEEKRQRYDAQCKLAELRKEMMEKHGARGTDVRTAAYQMPTEAPRAAGSFFARGPERREDVTPTYEERRPAGHASPFAGPKADYFEPAPRPTTRKESSYERKRTSPREDRHKSAKDTKEAERARQRDKTRQADKNMRRDRDRKSSYVEDVSDSDSDDDFGLASRRGRDPETRRARARADREAAVRGYYDNEGWASKTYSQYAGARDYIQKSGGTPPQPSKRPSPTRQSSSKDKVEYVRGADGRPVAIRRGSGRSRTASREPDEPRPAKQERDRRRSVDQDDERPRPPPLQQSRSSPADIRIPTDKPRAQSVQIEVERDEPPKPRRAETMPTMSTSARDERVGGKRRDNVPQTSSRLRQTHVVDGMPTPAATPDWTGGPSTSNKYHYGREYADDNERATPDGYVTEERRPERQPDTARPAPKSTYRRSPSPLREEVKHRSAPTSAAAVPPPPPPQPRAHANYEAVRPAAAPRTTSRSVYHYPDQPAADMHTRPSAPARESSNRRELFGEIPPASTTAWPGTGTTRTHSPPQPPPPSKTAVPQEKVRYAMHAQESAAAAGRHQQREVQPDEYRVRSGYEHRRPSVATRPTFTRNRSSTPVEAR